ncbi:MAG TPA: hypothetical protein VH280_08205 [Verrucomicrobiae bacterium]|nr:hypothetical protein [Verrucomicrobiae bacterium]
MYRSYSRAACAAIALVVVSTAHFAKADTTASLENAFGTITFDGTTFHIKDGDAYDPISYQTLFTFDLKLSLDPGAVTTPPDIDGNTETTGTFSGGYKIFDESGNLVSQGTATATGDFQYDSLDNFYLWPDFTNGVLSQTSGTGLSIYPGATQFDFSTQITEAFTGTFSPASSVPLPAAATMGFGLLSILAPLAIRRRKSIA